MGLITKRQCQHNTFAHQIRFNFENSKKCLFLAPAAKKSNKNGISKKRTQRTKPSQHAGATKTEKNVTTNRQKVVKMPKTYRKWSHVSFTFKLLRREHSQSHMHAHTCTRECKRGLIGSPSKFTYPCKDPSRTSRITKG